MAARSSDQPLPLFDIVQRRDRSDWAWFVGLLSIGVGVSSLLVDGGILAIKLFVGSSSTIVLPPIFGVAHVVISLFGVILGIYCILIGVETLCGAPVGGRPHLIYARVRIAVALFEVVLVISMYLQANTSRTRTLTLLFAAMALVQWASEGIIYPLIRWSR
jgi:hypothetical protein